MDPYSLGTGTDGYGYAPVAPSQTNWILIVIGLILVSVGIWYFVFRPKTPVSSSVPLQDITQQPVMNEDQQQARNVLTVGPTFNQTCQDISNTYGARAGQPGKAANSATVLSVWSQNQCDTVPDSWTCQNISDAYNISPSDTNKLGGNAYRRRGCSTSPQLNCQKLSDDNFIMPGNWGKASPEKMQSPQLDIIRDAWTNQACQTVPKTATCQHMSNIYGINPNSNGSAPPGIVGQYRSLGCKTSSLSCQFISEQYGAKPGFVFEQDSEKLGYADIAWKTQNCQTKPSPAGYTTSLYDAKYNTGNVLYSGTDLDQCNAACQGAGTLCAGIEHNVKTNQCSAKSDVNFTGTTTPASNVVFYRRA